MRIIDADELERRIREAEKIFYNSEDVGIAIDCIDATKTISEWHYPSKGELPDKTDDYLVYLERDGVGNIVIGTYYVGAEEWCYCGDEMLEPVAWMPLPEPPKEEAHV